MTDPQDSVSEPAATDRPEGKALVPKIATPLKIGADLPAALGTKGESGKLRAAKHPKTSQTSNTVERVKSVQATTPLEITALPISAPVSAPEILVTSADLSPALAAPESVTGVAATPAPPMASLGEPADQLPGPLSPGPAATPTRNFFQEAFAMTTPNFDFAAAFRTAFSDAQEKAKDAYEKSTVAMGDANDFAKGNLDAMVESTKILASGLQELTTEMVTESREAFEALTAEVKTIAGVKSPADFFKLQSEMMRKQMDAMMANGTKHSEAFLKLASDAAAPLSSRVSMAVEKVKTTV